MMAKGYGDGMAYTITRNGRHTGYYRDKQGHKHSVGSGTNKRHQLQKAQEEEAKVRAGTWGNPRPGQTTTFSTYFKDHWLENRIMETNTRAFYEAHYSASLKAEFGAMKLRDITTPIVQNWVARQIKAGATPGTIKSRVRALQTILAAQAGASAIRDGYLQVNPCVGITMPYAPPREVEIYTPKETDQLLAVLDPWWRVMVMVMCETGVRWGEALGMQRRDLVTEGDHIMLIVRRTIIEPNTGHMAEKDWPKGKKPRVIGIDVPAATAIRELILARGLGDEDYLFSTQDGLGHGKWGKPLGRPRRTEEWPHGAPPAKSNWRRDVWLPAIKEAGIPHRRVHDLRASNISWMLAGGADLATVMQRSGHTQIETLQRYLAAMPEVTQRALAALAKVREA